MKDKQQYSMQIYDVAVLYFLYMKSKLRYADISTLVKADSRVNIDTVPYRTTRNSFPSVHMLQKQYENNNYGTGTSIRERGEGEERGERERERERDKEMVR